MALRLVSSPKFAPEDDVEEMLEAKMTSSGISKEDTKRLGITAHTAAEVQALHPDFWNGMVPAARIPYPDPLTGKPMRLHPNHPDFERWRALREPVPVPKNFPKYLQPHGSGTAAYFPFVVNWKEIFEDWERPLIITEGELKAAKATLDGFPTIGLGGVWSFRAIKQGYSFLPDLQKINWARREAFIIFDSDARSNEQVTKALQTLANTLLEYGAYPLTAVLPDVNGKPKTGLDDFLVEHGPDAFRQLLDRADHLTLAAPLWNLNKTHVYVKNTGVVVDQATGIPVKPEAFRGHAITQKYHEGIILPNGAINRQPVNAGDAWLRWPMREEVTKIEYCPGKPPLAIVEDDKGDRIYNTWQGWGAEPVKGDIKQFMELIDHLFTGAEPEAKKYFWQWMSYPIAHPGTKLYVSAVLHGRNQGVGKSLVGMTLGRVYGENFTMVTQENMEGSFNNWAQGRQMVLIDDVTSSDRRRDIDRLKAMITRERSWINIKHIPEFSVRDCITYLFSSNHQDVLFIDREDRRFFIHEVIVKALSAKFYREYDEWYKTPEAAAALHYHLKHDVDLTGFNPSAAPPMTAAKAAMARLASTDIEAWVLDAVADPDAFLRIHDVPVKADLLSLAEIRACYASSTGRDPDISQTGFARKLAACGLKMVNNGNNLYIPNKKPLARYYAVKRAEHWLKSPIEAVRRHIGGAAADEKFDKGRGV